MNITLLGESLAGLVVLLALLMFLLFYNFGSKKTKIVKSSTKVKTNSEQKQDTSLEAKRNQHSSTQKLQEALKLVLEHHGTIHPKLGSRAHPDFDSYSEILFNIARHQHISKDVLLKFDKALQKQNPEYKKEINEALMRGLNSR